MKPHVQHRKYEDDLASVQAEIASERAFRQLRETDEWQSVEIAIQDSIRAKTSEIITKTDADLTGFVRLQAEIQTLYWLLGLGTNDERFNKLEREAIRIGKLLDRRVRSGQHLDLTPQQKKGAAEDSP